MNVKILSEFIRLCRILGVEPTPKALYNYKDSRNDKYETPTYKCDALGY